MSDGPWKILCGDVTGELARLPEASVHCVVTSPPYWGLRDYRADGQIGLEPTPEAYLVKMVNVFRQVRRVLRDDGTLWLNIGDSFAGARRGGYVGENSTLEGSRNNQEQSIRMTSSRRRDRHEVPRLDRVVRGLKAKDLIGMPWRLALMLQADGWYLRRDIIWSKPSPMPESVLDRPTTAHEYIFLLTKKPRYFYDGYAIREPLLTGSRNGGKTPDGWDTSAGNGGHGSIHRNGREAGQPYRSGNKQRKLGDDYGRPGSHRGANVPWEDDGSGRNARSVWTIASEPYAEAHFATFPTELARRCIAAGTSEYGCCVTCGAPYQRVVDRQARRRQRPNDYVKRNGSDGTGNACANSVAGVDVRPRGWRPSCKCTPGPKVDPCVVLDPFLGSGTTAAVACAMGRRAIGIELNPEYIDMARRRIGQALRPLTYADPRAVGDAPLFQEAQP